MSSVWGEFNHASLFAPDDLHVNYTQLYSALDKFLDSNSWIKNRNEEIHYAKWKLTSGLRIDNNTIIANQNRQCNIFYEDKFVFSFVEATENSLSIEEYGSECEESFMKKCECITILFIKENTSMNIFNQHVVEKAIIRYPILKIEDKNLILQMFPSTCYTIRLVFGNGKSSEFIYRRENGVFTLNECIGKFGVWTAPQMEVHILRAAEVSVYDFHGKEVDINIWEQLENVLDCYLKNQTPVYEKTKWSLAFRDPTEDDFDYQKDAKVLSVYYDGKACCNASTLNDAGFFKNFVLYRDLTSTIEDGMKKKSLLIMRKVLSENEKNLLN